MGRHSAPDDPDDAPQPTASLAVRERDAGPGEQFEDDGGRHARHGAEAPADEVPVDEVSVDDAAAVVPDTGRINGVAPLPEAPSPEAPPPLPSPEASPPLPTAPPPPPEAPLPAGHPVLRGAAHNSAADLHLVRSHGGVLAACALAIVLPFAVEVLVLVLLGTLDRHSVLQWLWAPLVAAGVLVGLTLDIAHRRLSARAAR